MLASAAVDARLGAYLEVLETWNARINLIGRGEGERVAERHLRDSLALLPLVPAGTARILDLGSGAGLPGMVLAIATRIPTHLVDRDQRKCAFLREARRHCAAPAEIHEADFLTLPPLGADLVVSRATAALPALLDAAARHGRKGAVMLFHKSAMQSAELEAAEASWRFRVQVLENPVDPRGRLWRLSHLERRDG